MPTMTHFVRSAVPYCGSTINWDLIPDHMRDGVAMYIEEGVLTGDFLEAVFSNNLRGAFERADDVNAKVIGDYVKFLFNYAPSPCWGSKERVDTWINHGGLRHSTRSSESAGV